MCGIIALLINKSNHEILLNGLKQLQNRGYDSAGICVNKNNNFIVEKYASTEKQSAISILESKLENLKNSNIGIAHTRWATHGPKTDINSHPHISSDGKFSLVHNGIIENYLDLKNNLLNKGYSFKSQTDTEVIVNQLAYEFKICDNVEKAIKNTINKLKGTWGLAIMYLNDMNTLYCTRKGSPLLVSCDKEKCIIVSEQSGFCGLVNNYIVLENHDLCIIKKTNNEISINTEESYDKKDVNKNNFDLTPTPYKYWTEKEINEQIYSVERAISLGGRLLEDTVKLGGLNEHKYRLKNIDNLILLGCGTSYFAGLLSLNYFKDLCDFNTVQIFDGAEFTNKDIPKLGKTALILLSQSGETQDLVRCIQIGKENNLFLIGVINVVDSLIAREVHCGCYLNAGREVAVASTKSFSSQVVILSMIAIWFSEQKNINNLKRMRYIKDLRKLKYNFEKSIKISYDCIDEFLPLFTNKNSLFLLGKGKSEAIAKEGALKIKEITYIHAEGYSGSSLKHGPFALLTKDFPVIMIAPNDEYYSKMNNAYEEVKARYAKIIFITNKEESNKDNVIQLPFNETYADLLSILPIQLLAYKLSVLKGFNPDMPRNLAKVVTVE